MKAILLSLAIAVSAGAQITFDIETLTVSGSTGSQTVGSDTMTVTAVGANIFKQFITGDYWVGSPGQPFTITLNGGATFTLGSFHFVGVETDTITITGNRNGSQVSSTTFNVIGYDGSNFTTGTFPDGGLPGVFDEVVLTDTTGNFSAGLDDIVLTPAAANTAPTLDDDGNNDGTVDAALTVAEDSTGNAINSLLTATDADDDNLNWSIVTSPGNGSLGGFNATDTSGNSSSGVDPVGLTYTPSPDYSGSDSFRVRVSDDTAHDEATVNVTVEPAPDVNTISIANGPYGLGASVQVTVTFDTSVTVASGTPQLNLDIGGANRTATRSGGTGSQLIFSYTTQTGDNDNDGLTVTANSLVGNIVHDPNGNLADLSHGVVTNASAIVDTVAPTVSEIRRLSPTSERINQSTVVFRVIFSEPVTSVATSDFALTGPAAGGTAQVSAVNAQTNPAGDTTWDVTVSTINLEGTLGLDLAP